MSDKEIQWFPGHMAKTRRLISDNIKKVDAVIDVRDARIPLSSANPDIDRLCGDKPRLIIFNKASLADPYASEFWINSFSRSGLICLLTDCNDGKGVKRIPEAINLLCSEKIEKYASKGMSGRKLRVMVLGIPNVGKSTLINRLSGSSKAKTEDRPGVTRDLQWIIATDNLYLLDSPGVLWPKFYDQIVAENLALTGAIKDSILDIENLSAVLISRLRKMYPQLLMERYKLTEEDLNPELQNYEILEKIGRNRGFLIRGGDISFERTASVLLDEFRGGTIGRITLDETYKKSSTI